MRAGERNGIGGVAAPIIIDANTLILVMLAEPSSAKARCEAIGDKLIPNG